MEVSSPDKGVLIFSCELVADGLGGLSATYIAGEWALVSLTAIGITNYVLLLVYILIS